MGTTEPTTRDLVPGFAAMIAQARAERGWSRKELAEKAGVAFNTVYAIESEKRAPSLRVASKLATALGLLAWLHDPASRVTQPGNDGKKPKK